MLDYAKIRDEMKYVPLKFSNKNIHGFDNQRALFRSINWVINDNNRYEKFKKYSHRELHILTIDLLLYGLARFGYVLKANRSNVDFMSFYDIDAEYKKMTSRVLANALSKGNEEQEWKKMEIPQQLMEWIESKKYLPVEFRDNETLNLSLAFLVASISFEDTDSYCLGCYIDKLTKEERFDLCLVSLEILGVFGYSIYKVKQKGNFDDFNEIIAPYRKKKN